MKSLIQAAPSQRGSSKPLILWTLFWLLSPAALKADINWDADNAVGNFSYCNNWYGDSCPVQPWQFSYGNLVFNYRNNAGQTTQYYDLGVGNSINDIIWDTTYGQSTPITGAGNGIIFNQRIENRSAYAQSINIPLAGAQNGAAQIEFNPVNANLTILGSIANPNNKPYFSYGSLASKLMVGTALAGNSTVSFTIDKATNTGVGLVLFQAAQTWGDATHGVNIKQGEMWMDTGGSLQSGIPINLGLADANTAKVWLSIATGGTTFPQNITVANSGGAKVIGGLNSSGTNTYTGNVTLNGAISLEANQAAGTVALTTGVISGGSGVTIPGPGKLTLSGNNTYSGGTTLNAGTLNLNNGGSSSANSAIGTGTFTIAGGTIDNSSAADVTLQPAIAQNWNGNFTYAGSIPRNLNLGNGAVSLSAVRSVTVTAGTLTVGGRITGSGGDKDLTKLGAGTLSLIGGTLGSSNMIAQLFAQAGSLNVSGYLNTSTKFIVNGGTMNWSGTGIGGGGYFGIGDGASGTLNVTAGSLIAAPTSGMFIGNGLNTIIGTINVSGGTLTLNASKDLLLGSGYNNASTGTGNLNLSGTGTFDTGVTTGLFQLGNNGGVATINLDGGTLATARSITRGATGSNSATNNFNGGTLRANANNATWMTGLSVANVRNGGAVINDNGYNVTIGQALIHSGISGDAATDGGLKKSGSGILTLTGANTYTGATVVNGGTLLVNSPGSLASGSAVTVNSGTLGGNGTINGTVNVLAGGLLAPGSVNTIGTLTLANASATALTLNGNTLLVDLSNVAATADLVAVAGTLVLNGANTIALSFPNGTAPAGSYTLMTFGARTGSGTIALLGSYPNCTLVTNATSVSVTVASPGTYDLTWKGPAASTIWDTSTANWLNGASASAYTAGDNVIFDDTASTFNVTGAGSPNSMLFNNTNAYSVSATIGGSGPLLKIGSGTTTLSGPNTYSGPVTISGGTLALAGGANRIATSSTLTFGGTASLDLGGNSQTLANLTLANGLITNTVKNGSLV